MHYVHGVHEKSTKDHAPRQRNANASTSSNTTDRFNRYTLSLSLVTSTHAPVLKGEQKKKGGGEGKHRRWGSRRECLYIFRLCCAVTTRAPTRKKHGDLSREHRLFAAAIHNAGACAGDYVGGLGGSGGGGGGGCCCITRVGLACTIWCGW